MTTEPLKTEDAPEIVSDNAVAAAAEAMAEQQPQPVAATHVEVISSEGDPSRRRRRRRRRSAANRDVPQRRIQIFMLGLVVVLMVLALSGSELPKFWRPAVVYVATGTHPAGPPPTTSGFPFHFHPRFEVLALGVAALLLVYQIPGVEDKVLRALGLKKDRRR